MRNKKLWKRLSACVLAVTLSAGCMVGCGDKTTNNNTTSESKTVASESEKSTETVATQPSEEVKAPVELTYWCALDANTQATLTSFNDMEMLKEAQAITNVEIDFTHPASGTETEQFNLKMTNLNLEDVMEYSWGSYPGGASQAIADGIIIDLAPYIEKGYAPNYKKILDENPHIKQQITTDKGEIWAFAPIGLNSVECTAGYIIRKDFLDAVNMEVPETIADWEAVLTAFKDQLKIEAPLTMQTGGLIGVNSYFAGAFDTYPGYYLREGKVQYGYMDENYKEYLTTMAKWYKEGLIDQDVFGNDTKTVSSNVLNNKSGAFYGYIGSGIGTIMNSAKETNPDLVLVGAPYPVMNDGDVARFMPRSWDVKAGGQAAITTACDEEKIAAIMTYLDFWYSEEGSLLKNFGVEGLSYNMVKGEPQYSDEVLKNPDGLSIAHALGKYTRASQATVGLIDRRYYEQYYQIQEQVDAMNLWNENTAPAIEVKLPSIAPAEEDAEELAGINAALNTYVQEESTKFVMGLRSLDEFDDFVATMKSSYNVERALEIQQKAYEQYIAK